MEDNNQQQNKNGQQNYTQQSNVYAEKPNYQQQYNNPQVEEKKESEKAPVILRILSFFIPLLGLILFIANISENKEYAKSCGIPALIGFLIGLLIIPILFIILGLVIYGLASSPDIEYNRFYTDDYGYYYNINSSYDDYDM